MVDPLEELIGEIAAGLRRRKERHMADMAFTEVIAKEPKDGMHWTLGLAERGIAGYTPVKETGDKSDPLFVAKFPTRFATREEAAAEAAKLNAEILGIIDEREALEIVISSMGAQNATRR